MDLQSLHNVHDDELNWLKTTAITALAKQINQQQQQQTTTAYFLSLYLGHRNELLPADQKQFHKYMLS